MNNEIYDCRWVSCSASFGNVNDFYCHLKEDHVGRRATRNLCLACKWENCTIVATRRDHIISHLLVHIPLRKYLCQFCKKPFKRRHDSKKHERLHERYTFRASDHGNSHQPPPNQIQIQAHLGFNSGSSNGVSPYMPDNYLANLPGNAASEVDREHTSESSQENIDTGIVVNNNQNIDIPLDWVLHEVDPGAEARSNLNFNNEDFSMLDSDSWLRGSGFLYHPYNQFFFFDPLQEEDYSQNPVHICFFDSMNNQTYGF